MIRTENTHRDSGLHAAAIAEWENEGGAPRRPEPDKAPSWCVPPIGVPALSRCLSPDQHVSLILD